MPKKAEYIVVREFADVPEAETVKRVLEREGIHAMVTYASRMNEPEMQSVAPIAKLHIKNEDYKRAVLAMVNQPMDENFTIPHNHPFLLYSVDELKEVVSHPADWDSHQYQMAIKLLQLKKVRFNLDDVPSPPLPPLTNSEMVSLTFRNLFFTILQPGVVAFLAPYFILQLAYKDLFVIPTHGPHFFGIFVFVLGFVVMTICIVQFAKQGRGTLSPADPTKALVSKGLYKYTRNPMYVGVLLIVLGQALYFMSLMLFLYLALLYIAFTLFIILKEEPRLEKTFGKAYRDYKRKVPRWF